MLKSILVMGLMFAAGPCFANTVLECSLEGADVSFLVVTEDNGHYTLKETDIDQKEHTREVTAQEWASKKLELFKLDRRATSTLTKDADGWWLEHVAPGEKHFGYMPCN